MKNCKDCKQALPLSEFFTAYIHKGKPILKSECKKCNGRRCTQWGRQNKERRKATQLKHLYGITQEQYDRLLKQQNGVCAICAKSELKRRLAVDHDHNSGKIRGLLCTSCNQGIGNFHDEPEKLKAAIKYLRSYSCDSST